MILKNMSSLRKHEVRKARVPLGFYCKKFRVCAMPHAWHMPSIVPQLLFSSIKEHRRPTEEASGSFA